jgi:hypothetical protein
LVEGERQMKLILEETIGKTVGPEKDGAVAYMPSSR